MIKENRRNNIFLALYLGGIIFSIWILGIPKGELEWVVNQHWTSGLDRFFKLVTDLGSGILFIPVLVFSWFIDKRLIWVVIGSFLIMTLFSQGLKNLIPNMPRPSLFFENEPGIHLAPGIDHHCCRSFPSGHTASAFAVFSLISLLSGNRKGISLVCLVLAAMIGYSRVYLLQHFFVDVLAGSVFGVLATYICYGTYLHLYIRNSWQLKKSSKVFKLPFRPVLSWENFWL